MAKKTTSEIMEQMKLSGEFVCSCPPGDRHSPALSRLDKDQLEAKLGRLDSVQKEHELFPEDRYQTLRQDYVDEIAKYE